jgi:chromosome segregation ATPase
MNDATKLRLEALLATQIAKRESLGEDLAKWRAEHATALKTIRDADGAYRDAQATFAKFTRRSYMRVDGERVFYSIELNDLFREDLHQLELELQKARASEARAQGQLHELDIKIAKCGRDLDELEALLAPAEAAEAAA